jgi:hypothetical protein
MQAGLTGRGNKKARQGPRFLQELEWTKWTRGCPD